MNILKIQYWGVVSLLFIGNTLIGQESRSVKNDTLKPENVTVIKTFNPTINDAFKIETAVNNNVEKQENIAVSNFRIQSVPVASTFAPKKAKSIKVKKERKKLPPQNYASLAGGNFGNIEAEAFVSHNLSKQASISALLLHQSSQGGIDEVRLDDFYYDTGLQLTYTNQDRKTPWEVYFEAQHQLYNWYGLPDDLLLNAQELANIDPNHNFIDLNIGGNVTFDSDVFKNLDTKLRYFFDDQESQEINFIANSNFQFKIEDYEIQLPVILDILSGKFNPVTFIPESNYQIINFGLQPSIAIDYRDISFKLGASTFIGSDTENSKTSFFVYPDILATYQFKEYGISVFGGITGELKQNTYHTASEINPFVAPLLSISPTNQQFNFYIGAQGNLTNQLSYQLKVSYLSEEDKPLFQNSPIVANEDGRANFGFNNAFSYVYADVDTGSLEGTLNYNFGSVLDVSLVTNLFTYNTNGTAEAWNLPQITTTLSAGYSFNEQLKINTDLFYVGSRKDLDTFTNQIVDVDQFFDINIAADYSITKNWNVFIKGKNLTNQNYERWLNFPVQSAQGLIGVRYLFK